MIGPVVRVSWLALRRDRWGLVLSFVVPIAFFSILAVVFGGLGAETLPPVRVVVVDADRTEASARLVDTLDREPGLAVERVEGESAADRRTRARRLVRQGEVPAAIVVPAGFGARLGRFPERALRVDLVCDPTADPVAYRVVTGLVQRAVMLASGERLVRGVVRWVEEEAGPMTDAQRELLADVAHALDPVQLAAGGEDEAPIQVAVTDVSAPRGREGRSVASYYAAAIGVMFLLFTMTAAMRGLIAEEETGTLERLLTTELTMGGLLLGRWLFATALGVVQLAVMFLFAWAVFHVDLFGPGHLAGTAVMTIAAAAAAAAFGLVLGAACRTQGQLQGLSTVLILLMSALGGSMVPRWLMPEAMQRLGWATFNAWAVAGYDKVFWRDAPVLALWPEVGMLAAVTVVGLGLSRWLARRWERA